MKVVWFDSARPEPHNINNIELRRPFAYVFDDSGHYFICSRESDFEQEQCIIIIR